MGKGKIVDHISYAIERAAQDQTDELKAFDDRRKELKRDLTVVRKQQ
jgi:hypothetical protein